MCAALRSPDELINVEAPAWPWVRGLVDGASVDAALSPPPANPSTCIWALQVTAASTLGALAVHTGGIAVDNGWLRILGGGGSHLPDLATVNGLGVPPQPRAQPPMLIVGFDILGGRFALNGGALSGDPGEVNYWGPDTLDWQPTGTGHSGWIEWALNGGLTDFYASLRWPEWQREAAAASAWQGISVYPPPFTDEGRDIAAASRRVVPFDELLATYDEFARQLRDLPPGTRFEVRTTDD